VSSRRWYFGQGRWGWTSSPAELDAEFWRARPAAVATVVIRPHAREATGTSIPLCNLRLFVQHQIQQRPVDLNFAPGVAVVID
jgi:hypothetical protein